MNRSSIFVFIILIISGASYAHQDAGVQIKSDGELIGLPERYQPANLSISFADMAGRRGLSEIMLSIAGRETKVPACASRLINTSKKSDIAASASWYHKRSTLPPYLSVVFFDPGSDWRSWPNSGVSLLFNLETSKLIRMEVMIARKEKKSLQIVPVDLSQMCSRKELDHFYVPLSPFSR